MKKLKMQDVRHDAPTTALPSHTTKTGILSKFRRAAATGALALALALGTATPVGVMLTPREAQAQRVELRGVVVFTMRLSDSMLNLEQSSHQYRRGTETVDGAVMTMAEIPDVGLNTVVTLRPERARSTITAVFPAERDRRTDRGDEPAGVYGDGIQSFLRIVEAQSGERIEGFRWLVERVRNSAGQEVNTLYAVAENASGDIIGRVHGGVLAVGISYNPERGSIFGGRALLLEPGVPEPVVAMRQ